MRAPSKKIEPRPRGRRRRGRRGVGLAGPWLPAVAAAVAFAVLGTGRWPLQAQEPTAAGGPPPAPPTAPAARPAATQTPATAGQGQARGQAPPGQPGPPPASDTEAALRYFFNEKPGEGTAAERAGELGRILRDKGLAQDALGFGQFADPQMRERFGEYLGLAEARPERLEAYGAEYALALQLLRQGKLTEAWKHLLVLAEYAEIDGGVSWELANRVESIWNADRTSLALARTNDRLRGEIGTANRNADLLSGRVRAEEIDFIRQTRQATATGTGGGGNSGGGRGNGRGGNQNDGAGGQAAPADQGGTGGGGATAGPQVAAGGNTFSFQMPSVDSVLGKLQVTEEYLRSLEAKAKIKLNELKTEQLLDQAKNEFAKYISTLFSTRRYRHVLLAADFWRRLFDEGEYPAAIADQVNAALERQRDAQRGVEVFNYRLDQNDIAAATAHLQTAFANNEYHPAVLAVPRERKRRVEEFTARLAKMQNMIEARDFAGLEAALAEVKQVAPDFDATKPMAIVNAVKLESRLRLGKARLAAQRGELEGAMQEFQKAAEAWPGNPDLDGTARTFFESQDLLNQSVAEFDRLQGDRNYRALFERQLAFAPAIKDDARRQQQLREALAKVVKAEAAIEKANLLRANGDVYGAWEAVETGVQELPGDPKLNALRGEFAGKGAEFVAAINTAKDAEVRGDLGFSLTWYAIAQRQYPASTMANQGIDRLCREILEQGPPDLR